MSIINYNGDLLESSANVIVHQCNCYCTMGTGIALQIKKRYPEAYAADLETKNIPNKLGNFSWAFVNRDKEQRIIVNLYGQKNYGRDIRYTNYEAVAVGCEQLKYFFRNLKDKFEKNENIPNKEAIIHSSIPDNLKIGFPYGIGCGNGGGDIRVVHNIIISVFENEPYDVLICKL